MAGRRFAQVLVMLAGLIAWAVQFTVLYGVTSTLCAREWADARLLGIGIVPAVVLLATLAALAVTAAVLLLAVGTRRRLKAEPADATDAFLNSATLLISGLSLVTIAWHGLPAFILPSCA